MIQGTETITVERKAKIGEDDWGNPTWDTVSFQISNVLIGWGGTNTAYETDRTLINTVASVYLPTGTTILDGDVFVIKGEHYLRDGEAQTWEAPVGFTLSIPVVVNLKRAEG